MRTCEFLPWSFHYQDFEPCCIWVQEKCACDTQNMLIYALWNRFRSLGRWNVFPYNRWRSLTVAHDRWDRTISISAIAIADDRWRSPDRWKVFPYNRWRTLVAFSVIRRSWAIIWKLGLMNCEGELINMTRACDEEKSRSPSSKFIVFIWRKKS